MDFIKFLFKSMPSLVFLNVWSLIFMIYELGMSLTDHWVHYFFLFIQVSAFIFSIYAIVKCKKDWNHKLYK